MTPRYTIGIDLGTSNCALSFIDTRDQAGQPRMLSIKQLDALDSVVDQTILPSFLYFPTAEEEKNLPLQSTLPPHAQPLVVGRWALRQAGTLPGRVIHSAKSWLCHAGVDREGPILPWQSDEIRPDQRLSPVAASAHYLAFLRAAWAAHHRGDPEAAFEQQDIVITVPASFDEAAQRLTLAAAALAGFPTQIRLLEEPQAAFYHWLNRHGQGRDILRLLPALSREAQTILICDIGGGTSDFSLFAVEPVASAERVPAIRRIEVSEHLLLGGDNMDLALAHALEPKLADPGAKLSAGQWSFLLAESRRLKERALQDDAGSQDETFSVSIPGTGAKLFAGTRTTQITRTEVEGLIKDGFFPPCGADQQPDRASAGLKEFGLPYAVDPGITRHLAAFLRGRTIDAILFTGGALKPASIQKRLHATLEGWQPGRSIALLANDDLDLAVARGAACYGEILHQPFGRITGGYPHSLYLEIQAKGKATAPRLVCILPKGFEEGQLVRIDTLNLKLLVGKPVRFQPFFSTFRSEDRPGDLIDLDPDIFRPLPSLQTGIALQEGLAKPADGRLSVALEVTLNELGLLQITCVHTTPDERSFRWELDFNLRKGTADETAPGDSPSAVGPGVPAGKIQAACAVIEAVYSKKKSAATDLKPRKLLRELEEVLGARKQEWNLLLLRALWPPLHQGMTLKSRSPDHEASWLNLAGWILRPGYGADLDPFRLDELWRLHGLGLSFPKEKRVLNQWWILWRRTAGGLDRERQEAILSPLRPAFQNKNADGPELFRLVGSLERVNPQHKEELARYLTRIIEAGQAKALPDAIWALGRLLSRVPLYAGPDSIAAPRLVGQTFAALQPLDWQRDAYSGLNETFARAGRLTGQRHHDLDPSLREEMVAKMKQSAATPQQIRVVEEFVPMEMADQANLFGESFPAGLILF